MRPNPITLVWFATGILHHHRRGLQRHPLTQIPSYIPSDPTWGCHHRGSADLCAGKCGRNVDIGIPIVFPAACSSATPPANLGAFKGPVQSMLFVVAQVGFAHGHQLTTGSPGLWHRRHRQHRALDDEELLFHSPTHQGRGGEPWRLDRCGTCAVARESRSALQRCRH